MKVALLVLILAMVDAPQFVWFHDSFILNLGLNIFFFLAI